MTGFGQKEAIFPQLGGAAWIFRYRYPHQSKFRHYKNNSQDQTMSLSNFGKTKQLQSFFTGIVAGALGRAVGLGGAFIANPILK
jgi:hypothetical protein